MHCILGLQSTVRVLIPVPQSFYSRIQVQGFVSPTCCTLGPDYVQRTLANSGILISNRVGNLKHWIPHENKKSLFFVCLFVFPPDLSRWSPSALRTNIRNVIHHPATAAYSSVHLIKPSIYCTTLITLVLPSNNKITGCINVFKCTFIVRHLGSPPTVLNGLQKQKWT